MDDLEYLEQLVSDFCRYCTTQVRHHGQTIEDLRDDHTIVASGMAIAAHLEPAEYTTDYTIEAALTVWRALADFPFEDGDVSDFVCDRLSTLETHTGTVGTWLQFAELLQADLVRQPVPGDLPPKAWLKLGF